MPSLNIQDLRLNKLLKYVIKSVIVKNIFKIVSLSLCNIIFDYS